MRCIISILLIVFMASIMSSQTTLNFDYFRRSGKVDVAYYIKTPTGKHKLKGNTEFTLPNISEEQFFVIEFSNLQLGLDKNSGNLKQKKDAEHYFLHIPQDPLSMTISTDNLHLANISNDGYLSDQSTDMANKKVAVFYKYFNNGSSVELSNIQLKFQIESVEGAKPLKAEHKGGSVIKSTLNIEPNKEYHQQMRFASEENNLYQSFSNEQQVAYKISHAKNYLDTYAGINEERSTELSQYLHSVSEFINPENYDEKLYNTIVKFCVQEKEVDRCINLCNAYQDHVYDEPDKYSGQYLEKAFYHRIELLSDSPNKQWEQYCNKFLFKFTNSTYAVTVRNWRDKYLADLESKKFSAKGENKQSINMLLPKDNNEEVSIDVDVIYDQEQDELSLPVKEDFARILIHEDNSKVTIQTGGEAKEGYVVKFTSSTNNSVEYDPSFEEEKILFDLDKIKKGKFPEGKYKVSVYNKITSQLMASKDIHYNSSKLPQEAKYLMTVGCLVLGLYSYKKYIKL